jgi:multiple sugar transport system ATP-binding protein
MGLILGANSSQLDSNCAMALLELKNLEKVFSGREGKGVRAVKGIDLGVNQGEFMVLLGPSGCGKSTTLRMIAGLEEPTDGSIEIDGKVVNDLDPKDRDVAMVFQNFALYPHMTVYENMAFGLRLRGHDKSDIETRVQKAVRILELEGLLSRRPKALSGGQRQRVAVGRAIVREPKIFLFDEPLSNLDARMRASMRMQISRLHRQLGTTMVYVTHDQMEAMTMGDRICVMKDGEIMQIDTPMKVYDEPANTFVASFMGNPPMNLVNGRLTRLGGEWRFRESEEEAGGGFEVPLSKRLSDSQRPAKDTEVIMGIRAEHMTLSPLGRGAQGGEEDHVSGITQMVETMGSDSIVYFDTGLNEMAVNVRAKRTPFIGEELRLKIDAEKIRFFDIQTGQAIRL